MPYFGVSYHKSARRWVAFLIIGRKQYHLGSFNTDVHAAIAYNLKAIEFDLPIEYNALPSIIPPAHYHGQNYYGVLKQDKKFKAYIINNGETYHLGSYETISDAAFAYNQEAIKVYGQHAQLNQIIKANIKKPASSNTSGYTGVIYHRSSNRFHAFINRKGQHYSLGYYQTREQAALAYNQKALELDGPNAKINNVSTKISPFITNLFKSNKSGYRGVSFDKRNQLWHAQIYYAGKHYHIGYYQTREQAALAYNQKALDLYGPNATRVPQNNLNI